MSEPGASRLPKFGEAGFSADERLRIQTLLSRKLAKEEIATRPGPGGSKLSYIQSHQAFRLANFIFEMDGWSSTVVEHKVDFIDESKKKRGSFDVGVHAIVRVTLRNGSFREDIGYGSSMSMGKGSAIEKALKEAVTDGIKRTFRQFGDGLGNCLYDKQFLRMMKRGKTGSVPLDMSRDKHSSSSFKPKPHRANNRRQSDTPKTVKKESVQPKTSLPARTILPGPPATPMNKHALAAKKAEAKRRLAARQSAAGIKRKATNNPANSAAYSNTTKRLSNSESSDEMIDRQGDAKNVVNIRALKDVTPQVNVNPSAFSSPLPQSAKKIRSTFTPRTTEAKGLPQPVPQTQAGDSSDFSGGDRFELSQGFENMLSEAIGNGNII